MTATFLFIFKLENVLGDSFIIGTSVEVTFLRYVDKLSDFVLYGPYRLTKDGLPQLFISLILRKQFFMA